MERWLRHSAGHCVGTDKIICVWAAVPVIDFEIQLVYVLRDFQQEHHGFKGVAPARVIGALFRCSTECPVATADLHVWITRPEGICQGYKLLQLQRQADWGGKPTPVWGGQEQKKAGS